MKGNAGQTKEGKGKQKGKRKEKERKKKGKRKDGKGRKGMDEWMYSESVAWSEMPRFDLYLLALDLESSIDISHYLSCSTFDGKHHNKESHNSQR